MAYSPIILIIFSSLLHSRGNELLNKQINISLVSFVFVLLLSTLFIILLVTRWYRFRNKYCTKKEQEILQIQRQLEESAKKIEAKEMYLKQMEQKLNNSSTEIIELARKNDPTFLNRFQELYPEATRRILQKHHNLSRSDLLLCAMIFMNFTTKEIASYTFVERRTVETKKYRLKKKLDLPDNVSLDYYISTFY